MRFTVIGHSALCAETRAGRILVDPWLFGSAGWRSWWHFPPTALKPEWLEPDWIYLTHHHPDHFHYPSMRRIRRDATVLTPRFGVDVMPGELAGLGFTKVEELPHGKPRDLGNGVRVASYQYGFDDTAFVIADGDVVLVDLNDCKIRGRSLAQLKRDFPNPTFMFKGHSFAQAYPACYEAEDEADLHMIDRNTYTRDFVDAARVLRPRYAIPFGSMVGFLHPESRHVNAHLVTPAEVVAAMRAEPEPPTEVVPMAPGDAWSEHGGFERSDFDWYADREAHLERLARQVAPKLEATAREEAGRRLEFAKFRDYLERFCRELPWPLRRAFLSRPVVFEIPRDVEAPYWCIDFRRARVERRPAPPRDCASVLHVCEAVLDDAIEKRILHYVHGSMRIHGELKRGGAAVELAFWGFVAIWEIGYLPLRVNLRPRFAGVLARRWREALGNLRALVGTRSPFDNLAGLFGAQARSDERER